jgi:acetylornithine deacetylase/succinyl-diaminopimelate desuccinylase-like protein
VAIPGRQVELTRRAHYNDATMWRPVYAVTAFALALSSVSGRTALRSAGSAAQSNLHPTAQLLAELIRIDTSNPPGHELRVAEFLGPKFAALGFQTEIVPTPEPGKAALFARLKGDGSRKPILLAAHADVVGVEREKWTVDPFAGIVRDGKVIGRGAIDFKGGMAVFARAVMMLAENRVPLSRDVIFLAEPDEESATYNTTWLAERQWPKMECEFALNEGGWIIKSEDGRVKYVSISTADKSTVLVLVTARGTSTHASMPRPDSAIFTLSKALAKLSQFETPVELTPSTRQFLRTLAKTNAAPISGYFETLADSQDPAAVSRADAEVSKDPLLHAIIRNTLAPVLLNAGFRSNVIPGSAQATLNVRIIPGTDVTALLGKLQQIIGDPLVTVAFANPAAAATAGRGTPSSEATDLFRALDRQARVAFPGAEVTPYLFQAGTDAAPWRNRGVPVYGTYPYPITANELTRMHGNDEQVSVESLRAGTEMIYKTLLDVAGKR